MRLRVTAFLLVPALTLAACTGDPSTPTGAPATAPTLSPTVESPSSSAAADEGLVFAPCTDGPVLERPDLELTCGTLPVPVDHDDPDGDQIGIAVARVAATDPAARIGSLVLNPGGPGRAGLGFLAGWVSAMPADLLRRFDVVSFDPRGVGSSERISCAPLPQDDDPTELLDLRTPAGYQRAVSDAADLTQACASVLRESLAAYDTTATAHDLDLLRESLGDERLTYVGFSYGAKLGSTYARLFPDRIRALVLDAPSDPLASTTSIVTNQVRAFEAAFVGYAAGCAERPECAPIEADGGPRRYVDRLVATATKDPIPSGRPQGDKDATGADVLDAVLLLMYSEQAWPFLDLVLVEAANGDSGSLWDAEDSARGPDDEDENTRADDSDPSFVINCSDRPERLGERQVRRTATRLAQLSPTFGVMAGSWLVGCGSWPSGPGLGRPTTTVAPLLVVGSTGDPATPYSGAVTLTGLLGDTATLLTRDGPGHTSFLMRHVCVDDAVAAYLLDLTRPAPDLRC